MSEWVQAAVWGLVQGLTEFLPISSSGHLVVIPAFLGMEAPDLATSALLHLGTLLAVVVHYRRDLRWFASFRSDRVARRVLLLLLVASIPSGLALLVEDQVEALQSSTTAVGVALLVTGAIVWSADRFLDRVGDVETFGVRKAVLVGFAQLVAVIPGISRSGSTIAAGMGLGLSRAQAARFSFLLGVPAIAAAGTLEGKELLDGAGIPPSAWLGVGVAAISGYAAITILLRVLDRVGLRPFAPYCVVLGVVVLVAL